MRASAGEAGGIDPQVPGRWDAVLSTLQQPGPATLAQTPTIVGASVVQTEFDPVPKLTVVAVIPQSDVQRLEILDQHGNVVASVDDYGPQKRLPPNSPDRATWGWDVYPDQGLAIVTVVAYIATEQSEHAGSAATTRAASGGFPWQIVTVPADRLESARLVLANGQQTNAVRIWRNGINGKGVGVRRQSR